MVIKVLEGVGKDIFDLKYMYPGEKNWSCRAKVISRQIASAENDENKEKWERKFFEVISSADLVPGGRIIYGAGRKNGQQNMLNCYFLQPEDNVESIGKYLSDVYRISCGGGGVGTNYSKIRPLGDGISNMPFSAPGLVSLMEMVDKMAEHVKAGNNRRVALIAITDVTHPDLLSFLSAKLDLGKLNNFNISVGTTDRFLEACENDEDWYFTFNGRRYDTFEVKINRFDETFAEGAVDPFYDETIQIAAFSEEDARGRVQNHLLKHFKDEILEVKPFQLKAKDIWNKIWDHAVKVGCPGVYNQSLSNRYTNTYYFEELPGTNPCGEIPLPRYGNCCLANVNLANMLLPEDRDVDWKKLARTIKTGIRFLDNVLSVNHFPIPECKEVAHRSRRIGLGYMGLHHMLIRLGLTYGSDKCLEFLARLAATFRNEAYRASAYLSREKGPFPMYDRKKFLASDFARTLPVHTRMLIKKVGIRNAVMLTVPPTGTTSFMMGTSSGVESIFSPMFWRTFKRGNVDMKEVCFDPLFKQFLEEGRDIKPFIGAYDIAPEDHLRVQATLQKYVDSAISKTINLPKGFDAEGLSDYALAFAPYVKGLTVYREGSKVNEPLEAIPTTKENIDKYISKDAYTAVADATFCSMEGGGCG